MRRQNAHQRRRQQELDQARARLIAHLLEAIGPDLTAEAAQRILEQAKAWSALRARELNDHLAENPDALTAPSPHCPLVLVRLLRQLEAAGHGEAVTQLACAICGRTNSTLRRSTPAGRCCNWCLDRDSLRQCARCKQDGHIAAHREEGPICRVCYRKDPLFQQDCGKCGQHRVPAFRSEDGTALCSGCYPRPERECARCGDQARVWANTEEGPVCRRCYDVPGRLCGLCGRVRRIHVRAANGQPDICDACYRGHTGECSVCGRLRPGFRHRGGAFHCGSCQPRRVRLCADCGKSRQAKSTNWPVGPLCTGCYSRRSRNPIPCSRCRTTRISVGRTLNGGGLCGPCCGLDDLDVACRRCGFPGDIYADGNCTRCVAGDRVRDLLSPDGESTVSAQLQPVADALASAARPLSVIHWLQHSTSARLMAMLAAEHTEITHELLDGLPQDRNTRHVRETLVATGVLPRRQQETLIRLELWLHDFADALPVHQARIIRPFAEWQVLRDARRRSARGRYTAGAATGDRTDIRTAAMFLTWLDARQLDLGTLAQEDLDLWLTTHPTRRRGVGAFIRWTLARRLTSGIVLPKEAKTFASRFQTDEEHYEQLRRCLNDDSLPLEVRVVGALVRLYGLPVTRIVALTTDRFHTDKTGAYLTFDRNPVLLPPKLARLIEEQIRRPEHVSMLGEPAGDGPRFLLPGRPTSRPRSAGWVHTRMKQHDLPNISARNTAMIEVVAELPPIVVSDLFGVGASTAHRWARFVQDDWADYLAACESTDSKE